MYELLQGQFLSYSKKFKIPYTTGVCVGVTVLRLRPPEPVDEHVVIIGIDEDYIAKAGGYPIPDGEIADLLNKLETYKPRAIGLDLFKNLPVELGHNQLQDLRNWHKQWRGFCE
ncbi:CHASE2 domain-containing protein [Nostoc sp. DedSLP04]|uniref:CHASE2 domain-containing protein n=1 Tax=Nostoc sp. DedSLP04 TaxID=3075401 RepID=UPI002AD35EE6|nr:CHASE2 domain-containing protein [Nostoc sp. DedSLP04]MDZ8030955.1 CHASE2 domain-containing protein [Nostoc sp. DedSLP04]